MTPLLSRPHSCTKCFFGGHGDDCKLAGADLSDADVAGADFMSADVKSAHIGSLVHAEAAKNLDRANNLDQAYRN